MAAGTEQQAAGSAEAVARRRAEMKAKLAFISAHGSTYSIRLLCAVLGVARSWFHD
ncbi:hypothetical protein [Skermanella pratensis]|uniref:hypothetical protein n=1 Tax=Skermanella pratensis TaxID=2233999 RepID=UPI00178831D8|nr:hypothetical protein [Skermanella pratensis]